MTGKDKTDHSSTTSVRSGPMVVRAGERGEALHHATSSDQQRRTEAPRLIAHYHKCQGDGSRRATYHASETDLDYTIVLSRRSDVDEAGTGKVQVSADSQRVAD